MRNILFRGKVKYDYDQYRAGKWIEGYYGELLAIDGETTRSFIMVQTLTLEGNVRIYFTDIEVDTETIGQYTGIDDKTGKNIFEGDLCKIPNCPVGEIKYLLSGFVIKSPNKGVGMFCETLTAKNLRYIEVMGNIHDK